MHNLANKNPDFKNFLKSVVEFDHKNKKRYVSEFDEILSVNDMTKYLNEKNIGMS